MRISILGKETVDLDPSENLNFLDTKMYRLPVSEMDLGLIKMEIEKGRGLYGHSLYADSVNLVDIATATLTDNIDVQLLDGATIEDLKPYVKKVPRDAQS